MAKARKASVTQSKLMAILYGQPFSGKSTMASQLAYFKRPDGKPFRVLYLDAESGSIDDMLDEMSSNGVDLDNIYIVYTQSLGEVREYISKVKNSEDIYELDEDGEETETVLTDADGEPFRADALVVDGTTILNITSKQGLIEFSKKRNKVKADKDQLIGDERLVKIEGAGMELKDFQTINFKGQDLILDLMSSGVHCVITAREADEKVSIKDSEGKISSVATGKKIPEGFKGMDYNVKTVIRMFTDENNQVCACIEKDRTKVHAKGEIIEDPTLLDWQVVIDKTAGKKEFVLKNDLTKAVDVEKAIYSKEILSSVGVEDAKSVKETKESEKTPEMIRGEINSHIKSLTPIKKKEIKDKLMQQGLPTAFKDIKDVKVLETILKTIKE